MTSYTRSINDRIVENGVMTPGESLGDLVLTVGSGGKYATIQAALDFIATQPAFTAWIPATAGTVTSWAQNGYTLTMATAPSTATAQFWVPFSNSKVWLRTVVDTHYYPFESISGYAIAPGSISVGMSRIEVDVVGTPAVEWFTENSFTILLLDEYYDEDVTIAQNACITFKGFGNTIWKGVISQGASFVSGRITLKDMIQGSDGGGWAIGWTIDNTIKVEVFNSVISSVGDDWIYPTAKIGSFYAEKAAFEMQPSATRGHCLAPGSVRGDVVLLACSAHPKCYSSLGIAALSDIYFVDKCVGARKIVVSGLNILVEDPLDDFGVVTVTGNFIVASEVFIEDTSIIYPGVGSAAVISIAQLGTTTAGAAYYLDRCNINAPQVAAANKRLVSAPGNPAAASTVTIGHSNGPYLCDAQANITYTLSAPVNSGVQSIAYTAAITPNILSGNVANVGTLTGNITVNAPINSTSGQELTLNYTADATPGRTITYNAVFKASVVPASTANAKASHKFVYDGTNWIQTGGALLWL